MKRNQLVTTTSTMSPETALSLSIVVTRLNRQRDAERRAQAQRNAAAANESQGMVTMVGGIVSEQEQRLAQLQGALEQSESISRTEQQMLKARIRELEDELDNRDKTTKTLSLARKEDQSVIRSLKKSLQESKMTISFFGSKNQSLGNERRVMHNLGLVVADDEALAQKLMNPYISAPPAAKSLTLVVNNTNFEITAWRQYNADLYLECWCVGNVLKVYIDNMDINSSKLGSRLHQLMLKHISVDSLMKTGSTPSVCVVNSDAPARIAMLPAESAPINNSRLIVATDESCAKNLEAGKLFLSDWATTPAKKTLVFNDSPIEIMDWFQLGAALHLLCSCLGGKYRVYMPNMDINSLRLSTHLGALLLAFIGVDSRILMGAAPTVCIVSPSDIKQLISTPDVASSCSFKLC